LLPRSRTLPLAALAAALLVPLSPVANAKPPKCVGKVAADEWPTFGRDLQNSRHQQSPGGIGKASAPTLAKAWSFQTGAPGTGTADLNGTPIVAAGCVFLNTAAGDVIALDAATGAQLWRTHVPLAEGTTAGLGGEFVSSPALAGDYVVALVSQSGSPYAIALSRRDGSVAWRSEPLRSGAGYYTNATPVVYDGLVLAGYSPAEGDPTGRGGVAIIDAATGAVLKRADVVPDDAYAQGYAGAGVWTAPAIDTRNGYAYVGTGNPYSKKIEHPYTDAIVKLDVRRDRATFGTYVGGMKGNVEQYDPAARELVDPVCEAAGDDPNLQLIVGDSAPCLQLDLDFGAPPNLFTAPDGRLLIGDLQKSGVYHVADATTMAKEWSAVVGVSCAVCNAAATAWDRNGALYGVSSPADNAFSLTNAGATRWLSPVADGTHYQSTTSAGGAVFTLSNTGELVAFDAATGVPLLRRPMALDLADPSQVPAALSSSGIAVASGTLYVAAGNAVIAYRPGAVL
jgi:outer membrane protein assembly factor BamB